MPLARRRGPIPCPATRPPLTAASRSAGQLPYTSDNPRTRWVGCGRMGKLVGPVSCAGHAAEFFDGFNPLEGVDERIVVDVLLFQNGPSYVFLRLARHFRAAWEGRGGRGAAGARCDGRRAGTGARALARRYHPRILRRRRYAEAAPTVAPGPRDAGPTTPA